jgi:hypothetical protein
MNEPASPTAIVCGIVSGSLPGSASRANAPMISPCSARMRMTAIRPTGRDYPRVTRTRAWPVSDYAAIVRRDTFALTLAPQRPEQRRSPFR